MTKEGYVKYTAKHTTAPAVNFPQWEELNKARTHLHDLGLVGITKEGIGFGNLSLRYRDSEFIITGTSTGEKRILSPDEYCLINSIDIIRNYVTSSGPVQASSESMTHGSVYNSCPGANCVIHIHSRVIFDCMIRDKYPSTPKNAAFGTPEIALAIGDCIQSGKDEGQIVMAGHDEGVITYGANIETAMKLILELYEKYIG